MEIIPHTNIDFNRWDALVASDELTPYDYSYYLNAVSEKWYVYADPEYTKGFAFSTASRLGVENVTIAPFVRAHRFYGNWTSEEISAAFREIKKRFRGCIFQSDRQIGNKVRSYQIAEEISLSSHAKRNIQKAGKNNLIIRNSEKIEPAFRILAAELEQKIAGFNKDQQTILFNLLIELNKNKMDIIRYSTFHEKKQMLPIDQTAYAKDFQERYENEFVQRWNKYEIDTETIVSSSTSQLSSLKLRRKADDEDRLSDLEGRTDPDGRQSEVDKEEIKQIFGISHALETFEDYKEIKQWTNQDTTLPVYSQKEQILKSIQQNSITIIQGNTGSGKSTQIPQYILHDFVEQGKPVNIVVTQPRRIAARSLCEHICQQRNWPIGQTVGYQTSLNKQRSELTRILYCTTGVLLQRLI